MKAITENQFIEIKKHADAKDNPELIQRAYGIARCTYNNIKRSESFEEFKLFSTGKFTQKMMEERREAIKAQKAQERREKKENNTKTVPDGSEAGGEKTVTLTETDALSKHFLLNRAHKDMECLMALAGEIRDLQKAQNELLASLLSKWE